MLRTLEQAAPAISSQLSTLKLATCRLGVQASQEAFDERFSFGLELSCPRSADRALKPYLSFGLELQAF